MGRQERKVRTLKGSEPANGGAFQDNLGFEISDLKFWSDDKCNREQTSLLPAPVGHRFGGGCRKAAAGDG